MSDTPETDAAWKEGNAIREWTCRKLERERNEAREKAERYRLEANAIMLQRDEARRELSLKQQTLTIAEGTLFDLRKELKEWAAMCGRYKQERDEARESLKHIGEYGTEEINAAVDLRQKLASALVERDEAREERDKLQVMRKEVIAANKGAKINAQVSNSLAGKLNQAERERDEARKEIENVKLQLRLWEDGNLICEETLGEIRLFEEQIKQALLERNKAHEIAEQAIDDLAWFNETNAQRLRTELEQLKEGAR